MRSRGVGGSPAETARVDEPLGHAALDLVGEATAGEAKVGGDFLFGAALPPFHGVADEPANEPAERTRPGDGVAGPGASETCGMGEYGHGQSPVYERIIFT